MKSSTAAKPAKERVEREGPYQKSWTIQKAKRPVGRQTCRKLYLKQQLKDEEALYWRDVVGPGPLTHGEPIVPAADWLHAKNLVWKRD